jgi:hypothetical protein
VRATGQFDSHLHALAVVEQHTAGLEARDVHASAIAVHVVEVQLVELQRTIVAARVVRGSLEAKLVSFEVQGPGELLEVEVESQDAVEARRCQIEAATVDCEFVTMAQERVAPGAHGLEIGRVRKQFVAGGDIDEVAVERDAAQAAVPATPLPVDVRRVPVDRLTDVALLEIEQVNTAVTLPLTAATDDRGRNQFHEVPALSGQAQPVETAITISS